MWISETFADIGGYAVAGLFVALLGPRLPLAFWADAVTYVASAFLIGSFGCSSQACARRGCGCQFRVPQRTSSSWVFLRGEPTVFANAIQATAAQFMLGVLIALLPIYAEQHVADAPMSATAVYGFLEGGIGAGNLIGGFLIGLIGSRIALGRLVIIGYVFTGGCIAALALTGNFGAALALTFGAGVGNLAFVIPSQTIVQTRTPPELMGRLLGLQFTMVFGSMAIARAGTEGFKVLKKLTQEYAQTREQEVLGSTLHSKKKPTMR